MYPNRIVVMFCGLLSMLLSSGCIVVHDRDDGFSFRGAHRVVGDFVKERVRNDSSPHWASARRYFPDVHFSDSTVAVLEETEDEIDEFNTQLVKADAADESTKRAAALRKAKQRAASAKSHEVAGLQALLATLAVDIKAAANTYGTIPAHDFRSRQELADEISSMVSVYAEIQAYYTAAMELPEDFTGERIDFGIRAQELMASGVVEIPGMTPTQESTLVSILGAPEDSPPEGIAAASGE